MKNLKETQQALHHFLQGKASDIANRVVGKNATEVNRRLGIYREAYQLRLEDNLRKQFPVFASREAKRFSDLAWEYQEKFPPDDTLIRRYGARFPEFLQEKGEAFLAELAAFEWAMNVALDDSADETLLTLQDLQQGGEEALLGRQFHFHPSLQMFSFAFDIPTFWTVARKNPRTPQVKKLAEALEVSVWRKDLVPYHATRTKEETALLNAAKAGKTFAELCELSDPSFVASAVLRWVQEGLIVC